MARLFELAHEVDFAAFVFARDDWTAAGLPESPPTDSGQASPRDNVVFEAGLFRWSPRNEPNLHPPCDRREASRAISSGLSSYGTPK
ncbi:MAG: TIR domain-containing protein [Pseudolabrys sp.]